MASLTFISQRSRIRTLCECSDNAIVCNRYKIVKDPDLVSKLSSHCEEPKAFARDLEFDDDMIKEMTNLLDWIIAAISVSLSYNLYL